MGSIYNSRRKWKLGLTFAAVLIAMVSVIVSDFLVKDPAREGRQKIEVWGEVTRVMTSGNPSLNMNLILKIIQGSTSIPAMLCSEVDSVISYNNIEIPEKDAAQFMTNKIKELRTKSPLIIIDMKDDTYQYLYCDDLIILKRLLVYPYTQLSAVFVFILIAFLALASIKKAEQNKVWVGLSKETAHQLGTPIPPLIAWVEYLRTKDVGPSLLTEMDKDVKRLQTVAEHFSRIGSDPDPALTSIVESICAALGYMETRISSKTKINTYLPEQPISVLVNDSLFVWVIENLTKNVVDATEGQGKISLKVEKREKAALVDSTNTGKGIPRSKFKTVFNPGYTAKKRGWELGLSSVKRIVESFQGGKVFVKSSELRKGTTFHIKLKKYKG